MKKLIGCILILCITGTAHAQHSSDTLLRACGFFVSPAVTDMINKNDTADQKPSFGLNFGYRFVNQLKYGFFIEGGVTISWISTTLPRQIMSVYTWGRNWDYYKDVKANQMYLGSAEKL